jgi:DNA-binding Xre family transcriptional regulator
VRITSRYVADGDALRKKRAASIPAGHDSLLYGLWPTYTREATRRPALVRESDEDERNELWVKMIAKDYERARGMNLPEPTWLPEKTLADYARVMGLRRPATAVDPSHIRIRIKRMRWVRRRMTQAQLAEKIGMSQAAISYIESGSRLIRLTQLIAIARALDVTPEWLVRPPDEED